MQTLARRLSKQGSVLVLTMKSVADVHAVKGLLRVLDLDRRLIVLRFGDEATPRMMRKEFSGFRTVKKLPSVCVEINFDTDGKDRLDGPGRVIFNYVPYKFFALRRASFSLKKRRALRRAVGAGKNRKIICVLCTSRDEVFTVLKAVRRLKLPEKPLVIFGLRRPDRRLARLAAAKGFKSLDRHSLHQPLSGFSGAEAVILNTAGEFFEFLRGADLAIIGHDRNLYEPACLRVPILYFGMPLGMTQKEKAAAGLFNLIWRKNRMAKRFLDKNKGAVRINLKQLSRQIDSVLFHPRPLIEGAQKAVRKLESEIPAARKRVFKILGQALAGKS